MPHAPRQEEGTLDPIFVGAVIAVVSATVLIFIAAHQNPVPRDRAIRPHASRAAINAAEEHKIWARKPADNP